MNQNLKNFIEEGEKEFDEKFINLCSIVIPPTGNHKDIDRKEEVKQFISSRQISLIKMIVEIVEGGKKPKPTKPAVDELGRPNLSPTEQFERTEDRGFNKGLDTISSKLKEVTDGK